MLSLEAILISLIHITTKSHVDFWRSMLPPISMVMTVGCASEGDHKDLRPMLRTIMMSMYYAMAKGFLMSLVCAAIRDQAGVLGLCCCRMCCGLSVL